MDQSPSPLVTIGLPVHNGAKFIRPTIDSILSQTYRNFELVISDNASTDKTKEICLAYAESDQRIKYLRCPTNLGASENFNSLLANANGEYFKWAAADDLIAPNFLATCIELLESRPDFVLCHTRTITIDEAGRELPNDIVTASGAAEDPSCAAVATVPSDRFRAVLLGDSAVIDFWGVTRTSALQAAGSLRPLIGDEKILMAALSLQGRFAECSSSLFAYRLHSNQISSRPSAHGDWSGNHTSKRDYPRFKYLEGYLTAVVNSDLPIYEKARCILAIGRYLFQFRKWKRVLSSMIFGAQFNAGNDKIRDQNRNTKIQISHDREWIRNG